MYKRIHIHFISFYLCLLTINILWAQSDTLKILPGQGSVGSTNNPIPIHLLNSVKVAGLQFTVGDEHDFFTLEHIETTARTRDFSVARKNNKVLVYGLNGEFIAQGEGPILTRYIRVLDSAYQGVHSLTFIDEPILSDTQALAIESVALVPGTFMVGDVTNVDLHSFTASVNGNSVTLEWTGIFQGQPSKFEIHKSRNNRVFTKIAFVQNALLHDGKPVYQFTDTELEEGQYFYTDFSR